MSSSALRKHVQTAVHAAETKKATNAAILEMERGAFTDYLVLFDGANPRQVQAIADEVELKLKQFGQVPNSREGYNLGEWVLLDYVDFVVQIFHEDKRRFYDLDRLWKAAKRVRMADLKAKPTRAIKKPATKIKAAVKSKSAPKKKAAAKPKKKPAAGPRAKSKKKK
ncbi:MAG: ribosome silencing factor [Acidobacteriales bacterium]|nr:ribosome silencing factor [Terriglobales bacterium]